MKKVLIVLTLFLVSFSVFAEEFEKKYVAVESLKLKETPGFFSKNVTELSYGQEVYVVDSRGNKSFIAVADDLDTYGWVSTTSLTSKKIIVRNDKSVTTTTDELALAGKGFSQEVEDFYENETGIDFTDVDSIESTTVSDLSLLKFLIDGKLNGDLE